VITNIIPSPYTTGYVPSEYYSSLIRQSTIPRVLTAPSTRKASRIIHYPSTLAQWLFFISDNKYYPKSLHDGLCSVRVLFFIDPSESTIPQVLTAPSTRKASRIIHYPCTLAQWLLFISDNKYYPKSLHDGLCSVRVIFLRVLLLEYLHHRLHIKLREYFIIRILKHNGCFLSVITKINLSLYTGYVSSKYYSILIR
jgi:hypothetical protein